MIHIIETFKVDNTGINGTYNETQLLGTDFSKIIRGADTRRKLANAINKHIKCMHSLEGIHPILKTGFRIKYRLYEETRPQP